MKDLTAKVIEWLKTSGFPLEMRVAAAWESAGFDVTQGAYYVDPETATARETDVIASMDSVATEAWMRWFFVVECKGDPSAPWVLFPRRGGAMDPRVRLRFMGASQIAGPYLSRISRRLDVSMLEFFRSESPAYGMVQAVRDKHDHAFAAVMSVAKAAAYVLEDVTRYSGPDESIEMVWPVIVTEAPLFEARLSDAQNLEVRPIEKGTLLWRHPTAGKGLSTIDIVSASALENYIATAKAAVELILHNTAGEVATTLEAYRRRTGQNPSTTT